MKDLWSGLLVAFSLYSAIPVPQIPWERSTMRWALSFLPLIGGILGGIEWLWYRFCLACDATTVFYAVIATLLPLVISGGIHLDGLCDTCDALCSFGDKAKRLAILKDPHVGAFGPLWLMAFLLTEIACFAQLYALASLSTSASVLSSASHAANSTGYLPLAWVGFALARALGGRKIVCMPCAKDSGLARLFADNSDKRRVSLTLTVEAVVLAGGLLVWTIPPAIRAHTPVYAIPSILYLVLLLLWERLHVRLCCQHFGGITGDLAGFFLSTSELLALACAAYGGLIGRSLIKGGFL